jgi:heme/copper-type cytochrome/quinol oxidase subunit 2
LGKTKEYANERREIKDPIPEWSCNGRIPDVVESSQSRTTMSFKRLPKWIIVLGGILLVLAGSAWLGSRFIAGENDPATEIHVIAHQWWWEFDYPKQGVKVANVLHVPAGRPVRLVLSSDDVLHSFWLPSMRLSVDVVPGQKQTVMLNLPKPGTLDGSCGAGCGCDTVCMRFRVLVTKNLEFQQWIKKQRGVPLKAGNTAAPSCLLASGAAAPLPAAGRVSSPPAGSGGAPEAARLPASAP